MNIKGILFISFILLVFSLAAASASDLGHVAISDSHCDSSVLAHVPVTVSSHDDSVLIDNLDDVAVDDSSIDDGQSVPDEGDDSSIDGGDKPIHVDPQDDIDGDINDGDSIIINITNDTPKNKYNDKPISNVKNGFTSFGNLQSLIDISPEGTYLMLSHNYYGARGDKIKINKDFVIDGQTYTIDCLNQSEAFYSTKGNIVLRHLNLINGDGAPVYVEGNAKYTIENCQFFNNTSYCRGGAIHINRGGMPLKIINCLFINTTADGNGGTIFCDSQVEAENCRFINSQSDSRGGAIYSMGSTYVTNCTFNDNEAGTYGGAIYSEGGLYITNCSFDSNYADDYGGAVVACGHLYINDKQDDDGRYSTYFYENIADDWGAGAIKCFENAYVKNTLFVSNEAWTDGGAFYGGGNIYLTHCLFNSNQCDGALSSCEGGAVYAETSLNAMNCTFHDNYAFDRGGALYCEGPVNIYNSTFESNIAGDYGGAIYSKGSVRINPSRFDGLCHFINSLVFDDGGAIYADEGVYGFDASFISNSAVVDGGAIFSHIVDLDNCSFYNNSIAGSVFKCYGGAIRAYTAKVINCIFRENYSENHGGAIFTNTFSDAVKNCTFYFNQAREDGGAVYINNENDVLFTQCTFIINRCKDQGGAIYLDSCSSRIRLENNLFKGNHAETEGHVVFNYGYYDSILNNWWADNIPTEQNGLLVEHKYFSSNINHVDSDPLSLAISCPSQLTVGETARATLYFVKSDGSNFTDEMPLLMEFVLPSEYNVVSSGTTKNSVWIDFTPEKEGEFTIFGNLYDEVVSVSSTVTEDSSSAGNSVASGFVNANSSIVKNTMANTQFAKSLCDFQQSHDDFSFYSPCLLILSLFGLR